MLLATCAALPEGEPGHEVLDRALAARGIDGEWAVWDDPFVEWCAADLVAVRSTWDYDGRLREFLGWAGSVGPHLLHGADVFRWNTDKRYLLDLIDHARLPVVPTELVDTPAGLRGAVSRLGPSVVKPRVGAGGRGLAVVRDAGRWVPADLGPWVVQPLVESVFVEGETSVFVVNGRPVAQVAKVAGPRDPRVHEEHGGRSRAAALSEEAALLAVDAVAATTELVGAEIVYARVDLLRHAGVLCVSEVEVTEPGLYLDLVPEVAAAFADALACRLDTRDRG